MKTALVFRFSAMGDVALTLLPIKWALKENPDLRVIMVTRPKFSAFFQNEERIKVHECHFESKHKGPFGLYRLYKELTEYQPDYILDLHQNLRTFALKTYFLGKKCYTLDKHRKEKKDIIKGKSSTPVKHVTEQYRDVFTSAGISTAREIALPAFTTTEATQQKIKNLEIQPPYIGIAPFAQHKGKIWPFEKYLDFVPKLKNAYPKYNILLLGGGKREKELLDQMVSERVYNTVGLFSLEEELELISKLDFLISGDTSNLHFGCLSGTKVYSIWGATHSMLGFGPLYQNTKIEISRAELTCRPCSVFGKEPCKRGDYACLEQISPEKVLNIIKENFQTP
ncbi:glycosyltransferase family 9 protein [Leadbetterella byssophila]|uniref:glycosyltransferase family 9 protein n=1 Tax=Leadbetterella byssophila TaxID=316068 RepID=UPI0039A1AEAF